MAIEDWLLLSSEIPEAGTCEAYNTWNGRRGSLRRKGGKAKMKRKTRGKNKSKSKRIQLRSMARMNRMNKSMLVPKERMCQVIEDSCEPGSIPLAWDYPTCDCGCVPEPDTDEQTEIEVEEVEEMEGVTEA